MDDIRKSIVAILARETSAHTFAGTGFLSEGDVIITCAHVVKAAREKDHSVRLRFDNGNTVGAQILAESPVDEHDIVLLRPASLPADVPPLRLAFAQNSKEDTFETYGFPELSMELHMLAGQGEILALLKDEKGNPVLQLHSEQVTKGYSGSPVWDKNLLAVVGMVNSGIVVKAGDAHHGTTFAIPAETLKEIYPALNVQTLQPQKTGELPTSQATVGRDVSGVVILGNGNTVVLPSETEKKPAVKDASPPLPPEGELPIPGILPPGSRINFGRNSNFTGRAADLRALAKALVYEPQPGALTVTQTLAGMGGIGKTQLAVEFCYRYGRFFHSVHWMDARQTLDAEIAACGAKMNLPDWPQTTPEQVQLTLTAWQAEPKRLLVLDNLEEPEVLRAWKPEFEGLSVLVTSRNQTWDTDLAVMHTINILAPAEGMALLRKLAPRLEKLPDEDVDLVANKLGYLPLALDLAGRYLRDHPLTPQGYLEKLRETALKHKSLKEKKTGSPTQHDTDVEITFLVSWEQLVENEMDELAKRFFIAAGYLAPGVPIPNNIFYALAFPWQEWDETSKPYLPKYSDQADNALLRLQELGLITDTFTLHPLLADFARIQESDHAIMSELTNKLDKISEIILSAGMPSSFTLLRPHIETLAPMAEAFQLQKSGSLLNNLGAYYNVIAEYSASRIAYEHALAIDSKRLGKEHPVIAAIENNLGNVFQDMGDLSGARNMYEHALSVDEKVYGKYHPNVAIDCNNLGELLHKMDDLNGAKIMLERALAIDEKIYGENHPNISRIMNNLGGV